MKSTIVIQQTSTIDGSFQYVISPFIYLFINSIIYHSMQFNFLFGMGHMVRFELMNSFVSDMDSFVRWEIKCYIN